VGQGGAGRCSTCNVEAFLKKTVIAYRPNQSKKGKFWWTAIAYNTTKIPGLQPVSGLYNSAGQAIASILTHYIPYHT